MTQKGEVISLNGKNVKVTVIRKSACEGCKQKKLCSGITEGCETKTVVEAEAENLCNAKVGDVVLLQTDSSFVLLMVFCIFILPLLFAFFSYMMFTCFFASMPFNWIFGLLSFVISLLFFCIYFDKKVKKTPYVKAIKIIDKE